MSEDKEQQHVRSMSIARNNANELMNYWLLHGNADHDGKGDSYMFQVASQTMAFLVACRFMARQGPHEFDRLNEVVGKSRFGFAAIDVPEDDVLMHGLAIARAFITAMRTRRTDGEGTSAPVVQLDMHLRDAARDVVRLIGEGACTAATIGLAQMDDEAVLKARAQDIERNKLMSAEPAGRA